MKAIIYERYGPPEVLSVAEVPAPKPGDGEVLIRVHAAEATKADCELRAFRFAVHWFWLPLRLAIGVLRPRRRILGGYFAGEVVECGAGVSRFRVGDRLFGGAGISMGAYGELLALPELSSLATMPGNMSFAEAAAVPLGGLNALHFLRLAEVTADDSVLIIGAGGSIGLHGVQIAKALGARVTAVDKGAKSALLREHGADEVIDYTVENFADRDDRYDVVFDMVPRSRYGDCIRVLKPHGRYVTGNPRLSVMLRCLLTTRMTDKRASFAFAREQASELEALREMIEAGQLRSIVETVYPMDEAATAHRRVESEARLGALVLRIG